MIKATIQNSSVTLSAERIMRVQEITFPCSETELSKKLGEIGINLVMVEIGYGNLFKYA